MSTARGGQEKAPAPLELEVTDRHELQHGQCWKLNPASLKEQLVLNHGTNTPVSQKQFLQPITFLGVLIPGFSNLWLNEPKLLHEKFQN